MNWTEFFAMKGYALYVWGSYGIVLLVLMVEIILVRHKRKITLQQLRLIRDAESLESI
jgi:heme exporter protein D